MALYLRKICNSNSRLKSIGRETNHWGSKWLSFRWFSVKWGCDMRYPLGPIFPLPSARIMSDELATIWYILLEKLSYPYELQQRKCSYLLKAYPILIWKLGSNDFFINVFRKYYGFSNFLKNLKWGGQGVGWPFYVKKFLSPILMKFMILNP